MSGRTVTRYEMKCDGCNVVFGENGEFRTAIEARAAAYAAGWRFPPKERIGGRGPSQKQISDVCPKCAPDWESQPVVDTWKNRR